MATVDAPAKTRAQIKEKTFRTDNWRQYPWFTFALFTAWVAYATVRAMWGSAFFVPEYHYLTPFYSPCVNEACNNITLDGVTGNAGEFGTFVPKSVPSIVPYALLSLPFLLGFRLTCYYYRKAYYRAFWQSPQACAVREPHGKYTGETRFPLIGQNLHRYFWIAAGLISLINTWDAIQAFHGKDGGFGIGVGTVILWTNVVLLWLYTLSCHSCRHVTGGRLKNFSKNPVRYKLWTWVSKLNTRHGTYALITLGSLVVADFYVMLVASDTINDFRFFN
ncbi:membrane protein [Actinocorallia lasiicapitis]